MSAKCSRTSTCASAFVKISLAVIGAVVRKATTWVRMGGRVKVCIIILPLVPLSFKSYTSALIILLLPTSRLTTIM